jgi:hypothetical protein
MFDMAEGASGDYGSGVTFDSIVKGAGELFDIGQKAYGLYRGSTNDGTPGQTGTGAGAPQTNLAPRAASEAGGNGIIIVVALLAVLLVLK